MTTCPNDGTLASRMLFLIKQTTQPHRRFKELHDWTGISADSWRKFESGKQRATSEMIEAFGRKFPHYCEWLLTGRIHLEPQHTPSKGHSTSIDPVAVSRVVEAVLEELASRKV